MVGFLSDLAPAVNRAMRGMLGDRVTYTTALGTATELNAVIEPSGAQVVLDVLSLDEPRWHGWIDATDLATAPAAGDRITMADGQVYVVDARPAFNDAGMWRFWLHQR
jgi:hypothetical protein